MDRKFLKFQTLPQIVSTHVLDHKPAELSKSVILFNTPRGYPCISDIFNHVIYVINLKPNELE